MPLELLQQNTHSQVPPARSGAQLGEDDARVEQAERLTGQMRVGGEVIGEIALHVRGVGPDCPEHVGEIGMWKAADDEILAYAWGKHAILV